MLDQDLINAKIRNIQNCLTSIKRYTKDFQLDTLEDMLVQDAVLINLERACQSCSDIAAHVVSRKAFGVPLSTKDAFFLLKNNKVISAEIASAMMSMVGFRNIAVHDYGELDMDIVRTIVKEHLQDFENFYKEILDFLKK